MIRSPVINGEVITMKGLMKCRMVLFHRNGEDCAAIVTDVHPEDHVDLQVFPPGMPGEVQTMIPYSKEKMPNTWRWPPKA